MKKRSKLEIDIRNKMSEILLESLDSPVKANIINLIVKYCKSIEKRGEPDVNIAKIFQDKSEIGFSFSDINEILNDLLFQYFFDVRPDNSIRLKHRYSGQLLFICRKIKDYLRFIERTIVFQIDFSNGLQGEIRIGGIMFNESLFFECHEYLEGVWLREKGVRRDFLKGLIHAAVAFYHLEYENIKGTVNYLKRSYTRLKPFKPNFLGVDVNRFLEDIEFFIKSVDQSQSVYLQIKIPKIKIDY